MGVSDERCVSTWEVTQGGLPTDAVNGTSGQFGARGVTKFVYVHEALQIQWRHQQTKDFPYSVPHIPYPTHLDSWTPGTDLTDYTVYGEPQGESYLGGNDKSLIAMLVLCPILGLCVLFCCCFCVKRAFEPTVTYRRPARRQGIELTNNPITVQS